jgi:uncharacterized repeat protein (TIGR03847 family)
MPAVRYEFNPVTHLTLGAVGEPGQRIFYLQARSADQLLTLLIEKQQVEMLGVSIEQFLQELTRRFPALSEASWRYEESEMALQEPLEVAFRVGNMGLGYDEAADVMLLVLREQAEQGEQGESEQEEVPAEESSVARLFATRDQMRRLGRWGHELAQRGRPICGNCGQPMDPSGHFCPRRNGHKH